MRQPAYEKQHYFLKDSVRKTIDFSKTDQSSGVPPPPLEKPYRSDQALVSLAPPGDFRDRFSIDLLSAVENRRSRRSYVAKPISLAELSFLLWATQGIKQKLDRGHALRTVPSAGARHALETYLAVLNVENLDRGLYRYLPLEHKLVVERLDDLAGGKVAAACFRQDWMAEAAAIFIWTTIPYRMEWRYGLAAHRVILIDAGHVCQNLYLACEAIDAGTCAVAAYDQELMDQVLRLDGDSEFVIYAAAVGKLV